MSRWPDNGDVVLRRDWSNDLISRVELCRSLGVSTETMYKRARVLGLDSRRKPGRQSGQPQKDTRRKPPVNDYGIGLDWEDRRLALNAVEGSDRLLNLLQQNHSINDVVNAI